MSPKAVSPITTMLGPLVSRRLARCEIERAVTVAAERAEADPFWAPDQCRAVVFLKPKKAFTVVIEYRPDGTYHATVSLIDYIERATRWTIAPEAIRLGSPRPLAPGVA